MSERLARQAGTAVVWKGVQLAAGRGVSLVRLIVLAWLLVPDDFGLMAIGLGAVQTISVATDFGLQAALIQRREVDEAHYNTAWTIGLSRAAVIVAVIVLAAPLIAGLYAEPRAAVIIQALALRPLLEALASAKVARLHRRFDFRAVTVIHLGAVAAETVLAISLAGRLGVWALVAGALGGAATCVVLSYLVAPHRPRLRFDRERGRSLVQFGRWIFLSSLVAVAGGLALQITISRQLGAASLGLYYLAVKLAFLPSEIAADVVGAVAFPLFARLQGEMVKTARALQAIMTALAVLLLPLYALMVALAPQLALVLGPEWAGTAALVRILAVVGLAGLFGDAITPLLKGWGQPYKVTLLEAVQSVVIIACVWWLAGAYGLPGAVAAWLPAIVISQLLAALFLRGLLARPLTGLGRPLAAITAVALAGGALGVAVARQWPGLVGLVVAVALAAPLMAALMWAADRRFRFGYVADLTQLFPQLSPLWQRLGV